jgi:hypothetical protein
MLPRPFPRLTARCVQLLTGGSDGSGIGAGLASRKKSLVR